MWHVHSAMASPAPRDSVGGGVRITLCLACGMKEGGSSVKFCRNCQQLYRYHNSKRRKDGDLTMEAYIKAKVKNNGDTYRRLVNMVKVNNSGDDAVPAGLWMQQTPPQRQMQQSPSQQIPPGPGLPFEDPPTESYGSPPMAPSSLPSRGGMLPRPSFGLERGGHPSPSPFGASAMSPLPPSMPAQLNLGAQSLPTNLDAWSATNNPLRARAEAGRRSGLNGGFVKQESAAASMLGLGRSSASGTGEMDLGNDDPMLGPFPAYGNDNRPTVSMSSHNPQSGLFGGESGAVADGIVFDPSSPPSQMLHDVQISPVRKTLQVRGLSAQVSAVPCRLSRTRA